MSLQTMNRRIEYLGGAKQQDRMITDKRRSLLKAELSSYNAANFLSYPDNRSFKGLMNSSSQTLTYDNKTISTSDGEIDTGDMFYWEEGASYWICYLRDLSELSYFKGECRRCNYSLQWVDGNKQLQETYVAVVGPDSLNQKGEAKSSLYVDFPNSSITVITSDNQTNATYFNEYQSFILRGNTYRVRQIDNLSSPGVLKMRCEKAYSNRMEDDVENDVSNVWNIQPVLQHFIDEDKIVGYNTIKPLFEYYFDAAVPYETQGFWEIIDCNGTYPKNSKPYSLLTNSKDSRHCRVTWKNKNQGNFTLCFKDKQRQLISKKYIVVESLF